MKPLTSCVVPYIGTWIETEEMRHRYRHPKVVPYIGTWIETISEGVTDKPEISRTLYRYVD